VDWAAGLTDVVLASVCGIGAAATGRRCGVAAAGLGLIGLAAALGAVRFLAWPELAPAHDGATQLAGLVGVPMVGVGAATALAGVRARVGWATTGVLALLAAVLWDVAAWRTVVGGAAMVGLAAVGVTAWSRGGLLAAAGAVGVIGAGLGVAGPGAWLGVTRVAWFHVALAGALGLVAAGLLARRREPEG
jgi:hypothetical protein